MNHETRSNNASASQQLRTLPKRQLLFLDGGGIRGISSLLILQRLMEQDYCYHAWALRMSVAEALKAYKAMARRAFEPVESWIPRSLRLPGAPKGAFSAPSLADAIKDIVEERTGDKEALFAGKTCCKTVVLAMTKANVGAPPTKFRTYNISDDFRECKIWEIARATSAATTFFESIAVGRQEIEFIDAGFGHNNPSEVLLDETRNVFPNEEISCLVSIGTGLGGVVTIKDTRMSIIEALKKMASNSEAVHRRLDKNLPEEVYFRDPRFTRRYFVRLEGI
ncbi:hypothetical protein MMC18_006191 [Xylographa bjoerkii]|nr:hypothetical protein [Xylographa bjoerkii]